MADVVALGWPIWLICAFAVFAGSLLQRLAGQGFGMIAAPLMALVAPEFLPSVLLFLGAVVGFGATAVDRNAVTRSELPAGFAGRTIGAALAAWIAVSLADPQALAYLVAVIVYLGVGLSLLGVRVPIKAPTLFGAGFIAGVMGTLTAVGAPPMALLYQHEEQRRSAAMQNVFFAWGMVVSITALAVAGLIGLPHLILAATLAPVVLAALWCAQLLAARVAKARIRPYALGFAITAATILLLRQVL